MENLYALDVALFRAINSGLKNGFLDWLMPFFSANALFVPGLVILAVWLVRQGGTRGRMLLFFLLLTFVMGDPLIVNSIKKFVARPRPFVSVPDIQLMVGRGDSASMPSAHAANWFAAMTVAFVFYRRSLRFMLPLALLVALSRVYLGAHYPSDVLAGAVIGMGYAAAILWLSETGWQWIGRAWFPIWWRGFPSLINPPARPRELVPMPESVALSGTESARAADDQHWLRLAYLLIVGVMLGHWAYLAAGKIELSEDEAYQWLWSKHLALSYFSKPPLIAYTQALGTRLWGDTAFGIRFFSPLLGAITSWLIVRFLAREANGRIACVSVLIATATPLLMVGATLLTIDSLSVLFWVAAMVSGWKAVQEDSTQAWLWTGLWMGLGFLSKYIALFQWICWGVYFLLWAPARQQLRRPGPYLALGISLLCTAPVWIWNGQHEWITLGHLAERGGLDEGWRPTLRFTRDFLLGELALLNPIYWVGLIWAAVRFWKVPGRKGAWLYLFSMGAPLVLFYFLYTFRGRVQPNWIAPAVLPLFCLMLVYWEARWRQGLNAVRHGLIASLALGWIVVIPLHDTRLVGKIAGVSLPPNLDPSRRVSKWTDLAKVVAQARTELMGEGKPVFVIGDHYGITSILSFYLPEARAGVGESPLVYYLSSDQPKNQFWFWPGYAGRKGENAIYVVRGDRPRKPPARLLHEFASVTDLGIREVRQRKGVIHRIQLFACRELR